MKQSGYLLLFALILCFSMGCETIKPYQKAYLNDHEMQDGPSAGARFEVYAESIREGASGQPGGKGTGGCGCN